MATVEPVQGLRGPAGLAKKITGWFIVLAVLFIILGILAIAEPMVAALAVALLVGWVLIIGGIAHLVSAFSGGGAGRIFWQVLIAAVYLLGGFYFLTHTVMGVGTLTLLLAGIILAEGVFEVIAYFKARGSAVGVVVDQRADYVAAGRVDLGALAFQFDVGDRNAAGNQFADDRNYAVDVWAGGAEAGGGENRRFRAERQSLDCEFPPAFFAARGIFCSDAIRNLFASTGKGRGG